MEPDKVIVKSTGLTPDEDEEDHEPEDLAGKLADKIPGKDGAGRRHRGRQCLAHQIAPTCAAPGRQ